MPDLRLAARTLARTPGMSLAILGTLAIGSGASLAVASIVYGVLFRPLPVRDESQLVVAYATRPAMESFDDPVSHPQYLEWRGSGVFSELAATTSGAFDLIGGPVAERVVAERVSANFFTVLGARPALGRVFTPGEAQAGDVPAVISHALWRRQFASAPDVVGRELRTTGRSFVVVGVMPPAFARWRGEADVWVPFDRLIEPAVLNGRGYSLFRAIGRLPGGVTVEAAESRLEQVQRERDEARPRHRRDDTGVRLVGLRDDIVGARAERIVLTLGAVGALVWLVVCANIASLMIASTGRRRHELAVRAAVGASRARLMRQLMVEGALLAAAGSVGGWFVAHVIVRLLATSASPVAIDLAGVVLDWRMGILAVGLGCFTALTCTLLPAWHASRRAIVAGIGASARITPDRRQSRASAILMIAEIATAMVVLVAGALLARSVLNLSRVELGLNPDRVHTIRVSLSADRYGSPFVPGSRHPEMYQAMSTRLRLLPGVEKVSLADVGFLMSNGRISLKFDDGRSILNGNPDHRLIAPRGHRVGPGYFESLGIPLRSGRTFTDDDTQASRPVVVVNETMAALHWPGESPLGRRVNFGTPRGTVDEALWAEVVGVVADVRYGSPDEPMKPEIYRSILQSPYPGLMLLVKTMDGRAPAGAIEALRSFDAGMPVFPVGRLSQEVAESTADVRYTATLLALFAGFAVLLALVGLYALLAGEFAARGRELAIRAAIGANRARLTRLVIHRAGAIFLPGLAVGAFAAWLSVGVLEKMLFQTPPTSVEAFGLAAAILLTGGAIAAYRPARRAAAVDPITLLRAD